ncbi:3-deoxy-D-manno-octulosonate 8-phosphate phosphatase, YrbI family [Desulfosporosinus orientis DSM 765]|uniref:3-deoxy-D-manno-octulosonate 8-phosphate phosphatase, YrbI family n=2 Tax=Desulfosporosinus orientis TaxID=1563 RepID=G7W762_DESOD|nr:3-deoxy-D-manno-octulosonate 8-phosphate phosphatase, YrbI family [Desulfosporosinus orientis DSM 765]
MVKLSMIVLDVDGTLTDGKITYGTGEAELKSFNIKDGLVIKAMQVIDLPVILLTGRKSDAVSRRGAELGCIVFDNVSDKVTVLKEICANRDIMLSEVLYIGDDLNDYAAMRLCGLRGCPSDAVEEICKISNFVSSKNGGDGAVREITEHYLRHADLWCTVLEHYNII